MTTQAPTAAAAAAMSDLSDILVGEVFEHADRFMRDDGSLRNAEIFRWLVQARADHGLINEAALGTAGSRWLLARALGDTLQEVIRHITMRTALETSFQRMTLVLAFASILQQIRMNQDMIDELADVDKATDPNRMQGLE